MGHQSRLRVTSADSDITLLTFGQHITSLTAGKLDGSQDNDVLLVGSQTNLLAYDIEKNSELYYKDVGLVCINFRTAVIAMVVHITYLKVATQTLFH